MKLLTNKTKVGSLKAEEDDVTQKMLTLVFFRPLEGVLQGL